MKLNRQLGILMHLLAHDKTTARELAEKFEVSTRTIRRDMEDLSIAGIPIYTSQGTGGGIRLMEGYSLSRVLLDEKERALLLTLLSNLSFTQDIGAEGVLAKLSALFGSKAQDEWLRVDLSGWGPRHEDEQFAVLRNAIEARHLLELTYINAGGLPEVRRVEPMTLHYRGSGWYLWGWCRLRGGYRTFRLSRVIALAVLNEPFVRRTGSMLAYEQEQAEEQATRKQEPPLVLHLRFRSPSISRVYDLFHRETLEFLDSGDIEVKCTWPLDRWVISALLSFGSDLLVLSPSFLREELQAEAAKIVERYAEQ
ncbi:helix-turn-helix transcriptional regulator [Gorillibacterium timonense]|uniref:helix-turn-helix transcriptional regulator n=1 Tax=Gorillibacterium timonense TaxID=1689269 RepID=UPI00071DF04F|nr:YafY family protein [Gorillibacterium timonense]